MWVYLLLQTFCHSGMRHFPTVRTDLHFHMYSEWNQMSDPKINFQVNVQVHRESLLFV